jgi:DNA polymerase III, alpha subunit
VTATNSNGYSAIRYGLAAIKHVGETAMEAAIREREQRGAFASLEDFCARLDSRVANRKMLESLIKSGAFDFLGRDRSELFGCIDDAVSASASAQRDRIAGQVSLFDEATAPTGSRKSQPLTGASIKNFPTRKSYSAFMSAAIHSTRMQTFSRRKIIDRSLHCPVWTIARHSGLPVRLWRLRKIYKKRGQTIRSRLDRRPGGYARSGGVERGLPESFRRPGGGARC